jgi:hypothetical protein
MMVFGLFRRGDREPAREPLSTNLRKSSELVSEPDTIELPAVQDLPRLGPFLWQDVAYGMTVAEVLTTRPDAVASGDRQQLNDGAVSDYRIPTLRLADHDYSVLFYFKGGLLSQVTIATNGGSTISDFHAVANALRLRYGPEVSFKENPSSFSSGEWLSAEGINVALVFHEALDCLNICFQYRYADAAAQL